MGKQVAMVIDLNKCIGLPGVHSMRASRCGPTRKARNRCCGTTSRPSRGPGYPRVAGRRRVRVPAGRMVSFGSVRLASGRALSVARYR